MLLFKHSHMHGDTIHPRSELSQLILAMTITITVTTTITKIYYDMWVIYKKQ